MSLSYPLPSSSRLAPPHATTHHILFIGPETAPLHTAAALLPTIDLAVQAESFIEAILLSGHDQRFDLILAGVAHELQHLERAVRSLRSVNPHARLVLLCDPSAEPLCRRAAEWGADDYHILPVTLESILTAPAPSPAAPSETTAPSRNHAPSSNGKHLSNGHRNGNTLAAPEPAPAPPPSPAVSQNVLINLPLLVQSAMMDALLQGRTDILPRGLATLQSYIFWPAPLTFIPAEPAPADTPPAPADAAAHTLVPVAASTSLSSPVIHDRNAFGTLLLDGVTAAPDSALVSQLGQAAGWLAGWMALAKRHEQLRSLAITDELSGAYNRRYFHKFVTSLIEKARSGRFRVTVLIFDIDNFKHYNDQFGHAAGDAIIRQLIALLRRCTRTHDLVARIGGDEFAVVFWDSEAPRQPNSQHPRDAVAATDRFRKAIEAHDWAGACQIQGQVSISGGIATFPWDADTLDALLIKADEALLRAKRSGKNVIILHESAPHDPNPQEG